MFDLTGKVALVTGGTSGIGEASVYALAGRGAKVAFCGRKAEAGKIVEQNCRDKGWDAKFIEADTLKYQNNKMLVDATIETYGRIDILVANSGGGGANKMLDEMSVENWQHDVGIYIHAPYFLARHAIPYMRKQGGGSIIFMSSASAYKLSPKQGGYGPGKAADWMLAKQISLEYCREGIRANCILPSATKTKMISENPAIAAMVAARANSRKYNETKDVTDAIIYLASDEARAVTETQLIVDFASSAGIMPDLVAGAESIEY